MMDNDNDYYVAAVGIFVPFFCQNVVQKVKSDDPYIINHIRKIADNVAELVNQISQLPYYRLNVINIIIPSNSGKPIILRGEYSDGVDRYHFVHFNADPKEIISPINEKAKINYDHLNSFVCLPIQFLDNILNFDNVMDIIYYKVSVDRNIHIFEIIFDTTGIPHIYYTTTDVSLSYKLKKLNLSGSDDDHVIEEFMKIVGHIFRSPAKSARN